MAAVFNLPNALTVIRIILIPFFVTSIIYGKYDYAVYFFAGAALTDALDGMAARLGNQRTALGTFLDPLADKFLTTTSFILFAYYGWSPGWLAVTVISRDIMVTTGWVLRYLIAHMAKVEPTFLGKAAVAMEILFLSYVLLNVTYGFAPGAKSPLIWATAALSASSGLHYIYMGLKEAGGR